MLTVKIKIPISRHPNSNNKMHTIVKRAHVRYYVDGFISKTNLIIIYTHSKRKYKAKTYERARRVNIPLTRHRTTQRRFVRKRWPRGSNNVYTTKM